MAGIPHLKDSRAVPRLLSLIRDQPVPSAVTADFLHRHQFADPRATLGVLRALGFVGKADRPTVRWTDSQDPSKAGTVLASAIRSSYAPLFEAYPLAHGESDSALAKVLEVQPRFDNAHVQTALATFRRLCAGADFSAPSPAATPSIDRVEPEMAEPDPTLLFVEPGRRGRRVSEVDLGEAVASLGLPSDTASQAIRCLEHDLNPQACVTIWNAYMELVREKLGVDQGALSWTPDRHLIDRLLAAELCTEDEHGWLVPLLQRRHACAHALGAPPSAEDARWYVEAVMEHISVLLPRSS